LGRDAAAWPVGMVVDVRGFGCVTALVKALAIWTVVSVTDQLPGRKGGSTVSEPREVGFLSMRALCQYGRSEWARRTGRECTYVCCCWFGRG
jgi:hypothetical protein